MKTLIVYYSRSGFTRKIAEELQIKLGAQIEELIDQKDRSGAVGWLKAGRDAGAKKLTKINDTSYNPEDYDLVVFGTPVWVGNMCPAIRTYIKNNEGRFKNVAFFTTQGSRNLQRVFDDFKSAINKDSLVQEFFPTKMVAKDEYKEKIDAFVAKLLSK